MEVAIIDCGMGNLASVKKALDFLSIPNIITHEKKIIESYDFIILPGVGSFKQGIENLSNLGIDKVLENEVLKKRKPLLGICLGMQLLAEIGHEPIECKGLGFIEGQVEKMVIPNRRVPHLGWNNVSFLSEEFIEFDKKDFYFIHSYHFNVTKKSKILATVNYQEDFVAAIKHENIIATQFHPEKSQDIGIGLLRNILDLYAKD
jgi:imidazole glycerol-phosphate synthase subunit HisH